MQIPGLFLIAGLYEVTIEVGPIALLRGEGIM